MKLYNILNRANNQKVTLKQLMLMLDLCEDHLTPKDIAAKLDISGAAVTLMLDRMELLSYVKRSHSRSDRRKIIVDITPTGRQICDAITQAI